MGLLKRKGIADFFRLFFLQGSILFFTVFLLRSIEFAFLAEPFFGEEISRVELWKEAMANELFFIAVFLVSVGVLNALLGLISKKVFISLFSFVFVLLLLLYLVGTQYYYSANLLFDHLVFYFSYNELVTIVKSEVKSVGSTFLAYYLFSIIGSILLLIISFLNAKRIKPLKRPFILGGFIFVIVILGVSFFSNKKLSLQERQIATSKPHYFFESVIQNVFDEEHGEENHIEVVKRFRNFYGIETSKFQYQYPYIHKVNQEKESLSDFFNPFSGPPNVVMVFCEGLTSLYSGVNARYGSMTPFLDSLYSSGLYWPHTLSNTDRTQGIFANVLASMTHGFERGVLNLRSQKFPNHFSIPKLLVENGYDASFTYGGWAYFDNYEPFLRMNYIDKIYGKLFFKEQYNTEGFKSDEFSWGIHDKELFQLYFNLSDEHKTKAPFFDIILNLSLHSPFIVPEHEKYVDVARRRFKKVNGKMKLFEQYKNIWTTVYYQDEAIKEFMHHYKELPEYENTIFLFVGDHNSNVIPNNNNLERFEVPLVIFSPKLKEGKQFNDIVSHIDIPQSIIDLLKPYLKNAVFPENSHWIGSGLSMKNTVSSGSPIFLGRVSGEMIGLLKGDTLLIDNELYQVKNKLALESLELEKTKERFQQLIMDYKYINRYVLEKDRLLLEQDAKTYPNLDADFYYDY